MSYELNLEDLKMHIDNRFDSLEQMVKDAHYRLDETDDTLIDMSSFLDSIGEVLYAYNSAVKEVSDANN